MFELAQRLGLDLADAFTRDRELLADFFQRVIGVHADAEAHAQHTLFSRGEAGQHPRRGLAQVGMDCRIERLDGVLVLDEVAEMAVFLVADRRFEGDRLLGDLHHLADLLQRHGEALGHFLGRRLAALLVEELTAGAHQLVDRLDHMHRDADGARLIGDRPGDRLADPPGGIGGEFVAAAIFELIHRLHQADIAFLDEIQELQPAIGVFLGDRDHEAEIGLDHFLLGPRRLTLALLDGLDRCAEFGDRSPISSTTSADLAADFQRAHRHGVGEFLPALARDGGAIGPVRMQLTPVQAARKSDRA